MLIKIAKLRKKGIGLTRQKLCGGSAMLLLSLLIASIPIQADTLENEIKNLEEFSAVYNLIKDSYIKEKNSKELTRSAIQGMIRSLDPYCDVLTGQDLKKLELQSVGQYIGIGVLISKNEGRFIVTQVFKDSPAETAQIRIGDQITKIDAIDLTELKDEEIHTLLLGEAGTELEIEFVHNGQSNTNRRATLKRAMVKANSVDCYSTTAKIGVLTVHQFLKHTARELSECMTGKENKALILDLRNNPGGLLISAVEVAELFVDIGEIVQIRDRQNKVMERYIARDSAENGRPFLIVLINSYTASAAEIVAGAIRDRQAGVLVGERSYGKGVVQSVFPVGNDLYVKLTTAQYYTPSEIGFNEVGIEPDISVTDSIAINRYGPKDHVFQKAVEIIEESVLR